MGDVQIQVKAGELGARPGGQLQLEVRADGMVDVLDPTGDIVDARGVAPFGQGIAERLAIGLAEALGAAVGSAPDRERPGSARGGRFRLVPHHVLGEGGGWD